MWLHSTLQDGLTALHVASYKGHLEVVELLLGAWANPNLRDKVKTVQWYAYKTEQCSMALYRGKFCNA